MANPKYPYSGNVSPLVDELNTSWGRRGAGSVDFWKDFAPYVYRDSISAGQMRKPNGYYALTAIASPMIFEFKGDTEKRNFEDIAGKINFGPYVAERIDGPNVRFDAVSPTTDPDGEIEAAVKSGLKLWADYLPMHLIASVLVNGKMPGTLPGGGARATLLAYDGKALFATDHAVNPLDSGMGTYRNTRTLSGAIDEAAWAQIQDDYARVKDVDGKSLRNPPMGMRSPLVMVPTHKQWRRYAHVFGGPNLPSEILINDGNNTTIQSVYVGGVRLMVNPYLYALASDQTAIEKRAFVFPGGPRTPFIFREEVAPFVETYDRRHEDNTRGIYIQAKATVGLGEPGSVFEIVEK